MHHRLKAERCLICSTARSDKIALANVRVLDGRELREPATVVIEGGVVGDNSAGARIIDAGGATLLPGLIDAHVHLLDSRIVR
jgi:imidazolonepropionase-like amidohydrolase